MKKLLFLFFALAVLSSPFKAAAQVKISDMPTYTGNPSGGFVPFVIGGLNKKYDLGNFVYIGGHYDDPAWLDSVAWTKIKNKPTFLTNINGLVASGDLNGVYPNPFVTWSNGYSTYDLRYLKPSDLPSATGWEGVLNVGSDLTINHIINGNGNDLYWNNFGTTTINTNTFALPSLAGGGNTNQFLTTDPVSGTVYLKSVEFPVDSSGQAALTHDLQRTLDDGSDQRHDDTVHGNNFAWGFDSLHHFYVFAGASFAHQWGTHSSIFADKYNAYYYSQDTTGRSQVWASSKYANIESADSAGNNSSVNTWANGGASMSGSLRDSINAPQIIFNDANYHNSDTTKVLATNSSGVVAFKTLYTIPQADGLIQPGYVTWSGSGLTFNVTGAIYRLSGVTYNSAAGSVTLPTADATNPRYDVIALDNTGSIVVVSGTASANPSIPQVDPATQVELTSIFVDAGATTPPITEQVVYDENSEAWTGTASGVTVNFTNTSNVQHGTKSADVGSWTTGQTITFTKNSGTINTTDYSIETFYIKLKVALASTANVRVSFLNGTTVVSSVVTLGTGQGFTKTSTAQQTIAIPISAFTFTSTTANKIRITLVGTGGGLYLDYLRLQSGVVTTTTETDPVTSAKTVSTHAGYGIIIPETVSQTISSNPSHTPTVDTLAISTRAWRQKLADSLGALIHGTSLDTVNVANAVAWSVDNTGAALVNSNAISMLNNSTKNKFYFPAGNYKVSCVSRTGSSQTNHQGILITRDSIEIYIDLKANFIADTAVTATTGASGNSKAYPVFNLLGVKHVKIIGGGQVKGQRNSQGFYNSDPNNDPLGYIADTSNRWSVSGVQIKDCNDIEIAGLSINSMQMDGVLVMNSTNIYVHDARTDTVGGSGFHVLRSSANVRFERCVADSSNSDNLRVDSSVYGNIYFVECAGVKAGRSSTSSNWFAGIYINQSSHVHVNNCNLSKNSAYGYDNPSDSTIYKDNTLTNSTISYNGNGGAVINGNATITDNWFINNGKLPDGATDTHSNYNPAAIVVNDASNATIENNHFYDTGWVTNPYGIKHWAGAAGSKIYRSKIKNNMMRGYADLAHAQDAIDATCEVDNSIQTSTGAPVDATTNGNVWTYSTTNHAAGWAASAGGGSGVTTVGSFNTTATANGLDISSTTIALHAADATNPGGFKASGAQTVGISNLKISNNTTAGASANDELTLSGTNYGYMSFNGSNASSNIGMGFLQGSAAGSANNRFYAQGIRGSNADGNYGLNSGGAGVGDYVFNTFFSSAFKNVWFIPAGTQNTAFSGNIGIGTQQNLTNAQLNFFAGSATLAPIKLVTGTLLTTPVAGAMEYLAPSLYMTDNDLIRAEIPRIQQSRVSTQFDKTSSTTLADITGLTATLPLGKTYRFEAILYTTSNSAGGVQFAIDYTGATPTAFIAEAVVLDNNTNAAQTRTTTKATAIGGVTSVTNALCKITGTITTSNSGNLTVKFAQNASNGTASSVLVGSTFVVTQIN